MIKSQSLRCSGIYKIVNLVNGKIYIGSAKDFHTRFRKHKSSLLNGNHHSLKLQRAWNKYGKESFLFAPVLICNTKDLIGYEQALIEFYDSYNKGYNCTKLANSSLGVKRSIETKEKIRESKLGLKLSEETKSKIAKSGLGKTHSVETKEKQSLASKGKKKSEEHIDKMRKANLGKKLTSETKSKISDSLIGNKRAKGYKFNEEQRAKVSKSHLGIKQDPEWVAKRIAKRLATLKENKLNHIKETSC